MSDRNRSGLPFDAENAAESRLWDALGGIRDEEPSPQLRQAFYRRLEKAGRPTLSVRLGKFLGFSGNSGWLTATACLLIGLGAGKLTSEEPVDSGSRLTALEENVVMLNRNLILDRLENDTAGKRLRGVMDAAQVAGDDSEVVLALLNRAENDRVPSIRSAAINALGTQLNNPDVGGPLMEMLQQTESPLVQMALVDLVLRNGSQQQVLQLQKFAEADLLHPDIAGHVSTSIKRDII